MNYSEFRSALYNDRHVEAFQIMNSLEHPDEKEIASKLWWQMVKPELVASALVWSGEENGHTSLWYSDEMKWTLSLAGHIIATNETLDLDPIQAKWATVPARHVLPIWETWAKENAPEHLNCVRELLDLVDQNADLEKIKVARDAAVTAVYAASNSTESAYNAAYYAARAAYGAAVVADWAAYDAAVAANYAADYAAVAAKYDWCLEWTKHVFTLIKGSK